MPPDEPLIHWPQPILEYLNFVGSFLAAGAIGFRYAALRRLRASSISEERELFEKAAGRAAMLGLAGALLIAVLLAFRLPEMAARRHVTLIALVTGISPMAVQIDLMGVALAGFALALVRRPVGWPIAAAAVNAGAFRSAFFAQWTRLVNPVHVLAGGMWIGTLFMLLVLGVPTVLRSGLPSGRRGAMVAEMVNAFSPLALTSATVLAVCGVITAWLHLKYFAALWTTPYGYALIAKLCMVLVVASLGAWNWRRQRPRLGTEDAANSLQSSVLAEVVAAAVVLAITAILVSLPSPKAPLG